ncbi:hypothetical protein ACWFRJ_33800 [Streptomyces sp. NPDC055239]
MASAVAVCREHTGERPSRGFSDAFVDGRKTRVQLRRLPAEMPGRPIVASVVEIYPEGLDQPTAS